jgi:hypothetical protein
LTVVKEDGSMIVQLRAANGQFVTAEGGGGGAVNANRDVAAEWETFVLTGIGGTIEPGSNVSLRAQNGDFLCAEGGGGGAVVANRPWWLAWETFVMDFDVDVSPQPDPSGIPTLVNGTNVNLQADNGQFVCAEGGGGQEVVANRSVALQWETFTVEVVRANFPIHEWGEDTDANDSDNHLSTSVTLSNTARIDATTQTWTTNAWTGFVGRVTVFVEDADANILFSTPTRGFGVDGMFIPTSPSSRTDVWSDTVDQTVLDRAIALRIVHQF